MASWPRTTGLLLAALSLAFGFVPVTGCGDDDADTTATAATAATGTATAEDDGPSAAAINIYVEQVRELVHVADQLNAAYRDLVERYNAGEAPAEEVIGAAQQNAVAYDDMTAQLEGTAVPEGLEEAHEQIVSGFAMWRQMYELDSQGLQEQNSELLEQARSLDNEAVTAVNEAINEINRLKD